MNKDPRPYDREDLLVMWACGVAFAALLLLMLFDYV